jgi:hypothetical protein
MFVVHKEIPGLTENGQFRKIRYRRLAVIPAG